MSRRTQEYNALISFRHWDVFDYTELNLYSNDDKVYLLVEPTHDFPTPRWDFTTLMHISINRLPSRNPLIPTVRYQVQMITVSKNRTQTTSEVFRRPKEAIDKVKTLILGFRTSYDTPETITT